MTLHVAVHCSYSRKYLFGNACVYGENNNSKVQGIYLVRGQDWKPVFEVGPDYESFEFTKLDPSKEEDRKAVDLNWAWEDEVDGKKVADGKVSAPVFCMGERSFRLSQSTDYCLLSVLSKTNRSSSRCCEPTTTVLATPRSPKIRRSLFHGALSEESHILT